MCQIAPPIFKDLSIDSVSQSELPNRHHSANQAACPHCGADTSKKLPRKAGRGEWSRRVPDVEGSTPAGFCVRERAVLQQARAVFGNAANLLGSTLLGATDGLSFLVSFADGNFFFKPGVYSALVFACDVTIIAGMAAWCVYVMRGLPA